MNESRPDAVEEARPYDWNALVAAWQERNPQALWRAHSDAVNAALLNQWLPAAGIGRLLKTDVFDEAFGSGLYPSLASHAQRVIGIDVSLLALVTARLQYPKLCIVQADVRRLPFADGTLDVIVSLSTLDHFESFDEIEVSLREFHRTLRPGGTLVLTLDNPANPIVALRNRLPFSLLSNLGIVPYFVGRTCGPRRLQRLLSQVGMEVHEITAIMHCPRVIAVAIARMLDRLAGAAVKNLYLRCLMLLEKLQALPSRFLTGHFVAARAFKR